jgi:hypothetical protein
MNRRYVLAALTAAAAPLGLLVACAGLTGPTVITLTEAELAALIARSFPITRRVLEVIDVQMLAPRLRLLPAQNRLAVDLTVASQERLFGKTGRGQLVFDSALRFEPRDASVRLTQVRVQQLNLDTGVALPPGLVAPAVPPAVPPAPPGAGAAPLSSLTGPGARLGTVLAERALEDLSIYRVPAERLASLRQLGLQPGAVTITARGLEITLARVGT